jgi:hypothetical protein
MKNQLKDHLAIQLLKRRLEGVDPPANTEQRSG